MTVHRLHFRSFETAGDTHGPTVLTKQHRALCSKDFATCVGKVSPLYPVPKMQWHSLATQLLSLSAFVSPMFVPNEVRRAAHESRGMTARHTVHSTT